MPQPQIHKVIIVGAGLGGLTLAALLEKAGIEYMIFERAAVVKPLGSAMAVGPSVLPIFEQLGILPQIMANSKEMALNQSYTESMDLISTLDYTETKERCGYAAQIIARPVLYNLLLALVPRHKVFMSKKVLTMIQNKDGAMVRCSDNSTYHCEILIGADGAYSAVRQGLYKILRDAGELPKSDQAKLTFSSTCLVGKTAPLDLSTGKYPHMLDETCRFETVIGDKRPFSWVTFSLPDNSIAWMVVELLDGTDQDRDNFRNSEWGPEAAEAMCKEVRDFPISTGTMGDLIDATPKELTSKVMLEEKLFETWYSGRTVLIGDACHKMHPGAGLGAVNAIQDAAILANLLHDLPSNTSAEVKKIFSAYKSERYPIAASSYTTSHAFGQLIAKRWINDVIRKAMNHVPTFMWRKLLESMYGYRPIVSFLPPPQYKSIHKALPQKTLKYSKNKKVAAEAEAQAVAAAAEAESAPKSQAV